MEGPSEEEKERFESFQSKDESSKPIISIIEVSSFDNVQKMPYTDIIQAKKR